MDNVDVLCLFRGCQSLDRTKQPEAESKQGCLSINFNVISGLAASISEGADLGSF